MGLANRYAKKFGGEGRNARARFNAQTAGSREEGFPPSPSVSSLRKVAYQDTKTELQSAALDAIDKDISDRNSPVLQQICTFFAALNPEPNSREGKALSLFLPRPKNGNGEVKLFTRPFSFSSRRADEIKQGVPPSPAFRAQPKREASHSSCTCITNARWVMSVGVIQGPSEECPSRGKEKERGMNRLGDRRRGR